MVSDGLNIFGSFLWSGDISGCSTCTQSELTVTLLLASIAREFLVFVVANLPTDGNIFFAAGGGLFAVDVGFLAFVAADFLAFTGAAVLTIILEAFIALIAVVLHGLIALLIALIALLLTFIVAVLLAIITATFATMQPNLACFLVKHGNMQRLVIFEEQLVDLVADLGRQREKPFALGSVSSMFAGVVGVVRMISGYN
jgi:hypothetical protein